jgi:hypothetical protein
MSVSRYVLACAALLAAGCGRPQSGCSATQDHAAVTVDGVRLVANSSTAVGNYDEHILFVSADDDACAAFYGHGIAGYGEDQSWLQVTFSAPPQPGQYVAGRALFDPRGFAAEALANLRHQEVALTGSVALTAVAADGAHVTRQDRLVGSYELVFPTNERITASFSAPYCEPCIQ